MNEETLKKFCDAWISKEPAMDVRVSGEYDNSDIEIHYCFLDIEHAGRYSLKFRNQGFNTSDFGGYIYDKESDSKNCPFYIYITSPDVNYYDGTFETQSKPAYDVMLFRETFSKKDCFVELSNKLGDFFDAVKLRDYNKLNSSGFKTWGISFDESGKIVVNGDPYDLILTLTVTPSSANETV